MIKIYNKKMKRHIANKKVDNPGTSISRINADADRGAINSSTNTAWKSG